MEGDAVRFLGRVLPAKARASVARRTITVVIEIVDRVRSVPLNEEQENVLLYLTNEGSHCASWMIWEQRLPFRF